MTADGIPDGVDEPVSRHILQQETGRPAGQRIHNIFILAEGSEN